MVIVPTYPPNRRYSSSSSSDCFCGIVGKFRREFQEIVLPKSSLSKSGNLILRVLCIIFIAIVVLLFLALSVYHVATKGVSFPKTVDVEVNVVPVPDPRWNGLYNGTYLAVGGSGRFSSRSASSSTSSVAYKFALAEHQFRMDRKVDPYDGRPYFEFKSRPVTASDYVRRLRFFSGEPFSLVIRADDWESSTRATITVQRELWREYYPGSPNLEVEREFLADGIISVTYSAAEVIYYKKFKRLLFS